MGQSRNRGYVTGLDFRHGITVALAMFLAGCSTASGPTASATSSSSPSPAAASSGDIVRSSAVRLGANWGALESYAGETFRWVGSDAEIQIVDPAAIPEIQIELEPGPSIRRLPMQLRIRTGTTASVRAVNGRTTIEVAPAGRSVVLSALNGGAPISTDPRVLNFRVFRVGNALAAGAAGGDVIIAPVRIGKNWGPLEHFDGQTFRWIDNDATFSLAPRSGRTIRITTEGGPGLGKTPFRLDVFDASNKLVDSVIVAGHRTISVPLPNGPSHFRLHVNGGGQHIASDPRILDFRVFGLWEVARQ